MTPAIVQWLKQRANRDLRNAEEEYARCRECLKQYYDYTLENYQNELVWDILVHEYADHCHEARNQVRFMRQVVKDLDEHL